ncbi:uncharacterized protein LOC108632600 [Ceratina calcarata]|uniref:Uncharacterized protein LOC108632600 n=1 Tax=Ceratina calcarata TaxID=156304 RepID=A0AAJ7JH81_9HYME|nr:uncharacterized protein LOC108632600 [Ceratina calcarata]
MTTTTGDPSTLKSPASLSGGDLVSRLLAATPPYLYNVPLTPHSFFFSEMLRSFVQAKTEVSSTNSTTNAPRRRKRSWRDARDRPLELTTKERQHHHHHHQQQQQPPDKYFHGQQQPQPAEARLENRSKQSDGYDPENKIRNFEQKPNFGADIMKPVDDSKSDFGKQSKNFFDERPHHFEQAQPPENLFAGELQKVKPEESLSNDRKNCNYNDRNIYDDHTKSAINNQELPPLMPDQKKLDFSRNFLPGLPGRGCDMLPGVKGFGLPGNVTNSEFLPSPLWYPPYPMPQSYPGIDPLHFFIDLRVSGHIWDRKLSERQLPFKGKHCSAFSVPQSKEYNSNRPLNLTRDEASTSKSSEENPHGTNYILRQLTRTYREIGQSLKESRSEMSTSGDSEDSSKDVDNSEKSPKPEEIATGSTCPEEERKDLRALIGLELVVDYVKEPKGDPSSEQTSQVTE